jgi:hypothetical protein
MASISLNDVKWDAMLLADKLELSTKNVSGADIKSQATSVLVDFIYSDRVRIRKEVIAEMRGKLIDLEEGR